jgi:hypothetical protein
MPLPRFAHQVAYTPFTRSVFLHGGNAGNFNESGSSATKGAGVKGSRDADGDNIESEDGREVSVAGVKERRLDDFWRMELKRSVSLSVLFFAKCLLTMLFTGLGQRRSLDKPSSKFDANSKPSHRHEND